MPVYVYFRCSEAGANSDLLFEALVGVSVAMEHGGDEWSSWAKQDGMMFLSRGVNLLFSRTKTGAAATDEAKRQKDVNLAIEQLCLLLSLHRPAPFVFLNPATESRDKNGPAPRHPNDWAWSEQLAGLLIAELRAAPPPAAKKDLVARRAAEATIAGELTTAVEDTRVAFMCRCA